MSPSEILRAAHAKIENPEHWCRKSAAIDDLGQSVTAKDPMAVKWCAIGACIAVETDQPHTAIHSGAYRYLYYAMLHYGNGPVKSVGHFNDNHTHDEVLNAFTLAIHRAEEQKE